MPIPKSWSNRRRKAIVGEPHVFKPDCDNLLKFIGDALNGMAWEDDAWIYEASIEKIYSLEPRTIIVIQAF